MGEGQETQQRRMRISPEAREKIKNGFRKAAPYAAFAAGLGIGVGFAIHECNMRNDLQDYVHESRMELLQARDEEISKRDFLMGAMRAVLNRGGENAENAIREIVQIQQDCQFDLRSAELAKRMAEAEGENYYIGLKLLRMVLANHPLEEGDFGLWLLEEINNLVANVSEKAGDAAPDAFSLITMGLGGRHYYGNNEQQEAYMSLENFRAAARIAGQASGREDLLYKLGIAGDSSRIWNNSNSGELADEACKTVDMVAGSAGSRAGEAVELVRRMAGFRPYHLQNEDWSQYSARVAEWHVAAGPIKVMRGVQKIAAGVEGTDAFMEALSMFERKASEARQSPKPRNLGDLADGITNAVRGATQGTGQDAVHALRLMRVLAQKGASNYDDISVRLNRLVKLMREKYGGRMGEVVGAAADFLAQKADTEVMLAIAERTSDAEEFIRRARYAKDNYTAMSREAAERICDVEEKYYSQSNGNRSVMEALRGFESDRCFYPGMARLVEMAIEGKRGAALVNALDSLGRTTRLYESPFSCNSYIRNVGYSDYDEGIRLAAALFGERRNMERIMNLSYAIHAVGAEKAKELYNKFGMEYFFRYSQEVLQEVARNADPASSPEKPILLAVFPKSDWNDAFYGYKDSLRKLAGYYRIMVVEVGSQDSLYERVNSVAGWYGKRISALVLGGHGSPASISLGGRGQYRMINISDTEEMERMRDSLVDGPVIVLNSCSTGAYGGSIAGVLARVLNARVYAPTRDSSLYDFMLDGEGGINGALYEGAATREYYSGTSEIVE